MLWRAWEDLANCLPELGIIRSSSRTPFDHSLPPHSCNRKKSTNQILPGFTDILLSKPWFRCSYFTVSAVSGALWCWWILKAGVQRDLTQHASPSRSCTACPVCVPLVHQSWQVGVDPLWICLMFRTNGVKNYIRDKYISVCVCICVCMCISAFCHVSNSISCEDTDYVWLLKLLTLIALSTNVANKQRLSELSGEEFAKVFLAREELQ